jgi:hypothetical protein
MRGESRARRNDDALMALEAGGSGEEGIAGGAGVGFTADGGYTGSTKITTLY